MDFAIWSWMSPLFGEVSSMWSLVSRAISRSSSVVRISWGGGDRWLMSAASKTLSAIFLNMGDCAMYWAIGWLLAGFASRM
eukprot:7425901-Pyramimonas_sp.AAC.1